MHPLATLPALVIGAAFQAAPVGDPAPAPAIMNFVPIAAVLLIFWVFFVMPTRKRQQKTEEMLGALKSGDRVVMTCGIHGTIVGIDGNLVQLRVADKVKMEVDKAAIAGVVPASREEKAS